MADNNTDTRSEIIAGARKEFLTHGYDGARLQRIADQTGATKAMIHYYFNTKKELFEQVYGQSVTVLFNGLSELLEQDLPLFKKIEELVSHCLEKAETEGDVLGFVLTESSRNTEWLLPIFEDRVSLDQTVLARQIEEEASNYVIAAVSADQLLLNIFSLCYYPAIAWPLHSSLLDDPSDERMARRKGIILDTILNWLTA